MGMIRLAFVAGSGVGGKWLGWKGRKSVGNCHCLGGA
jgi:hypothetical protein